METIMATVEDIILTAENYARGDAKKFLRFLNRCCVRYEPVGEAYDGVRWTLYNCPDGDGEDIFAISDDGFVSTNVYDDEP